MRPWQRGTIVLLLLSLAFLGVHHLVHLGLGPTRLLSGWTLLALVVALALLNLRKKLPFLNLGSASAWLQVHVYAGWFSIVVFAFHVDFGVPEGVLEGSLAALFLVTALSGALGIAISRLLPKRLAARGEEVLFERIPAMRVRLRDEVEGLILAGAGENKTDFLGDFYAERLMPYFAKPRHVLSHLVDSDRQVRRLLGDLRALARYAAPAEQEVVTQISERVSQKADLDYHYAQQGLLKGWLFVHIPFTYSLLLVAFVHALFATGLGGRSG